MSESETDEMSLDAAVERALTEADAGAEPADPEGPPASDVDTTAAVEAQTESDSAAGADTPESGVTETQESAAEFAAVEKPNAYVPREVLDASREQVRIYKELYEEATGRSTQATQTEDATPEVPPEFATETEERTWNEVQALKAQLAEGMKFIQAQDAREQAHAAVSVAFQQFNDTVAELEQTTGGAYSDEEKSALLEKARELGQKQPGLPVPLAVYRAAVVLQATKQVSSAAPPAPSDPLTKVKTAKEGLAPRPATAPPPGGRPLDERMSIDDAVERAIRELDGK